MSFLWDVAGADFAVTDETDKQASYSMHTERSHLHHVEGSLVAHQAHAGVGHQFVEALPELLPLSLGHDSPLWNRGVVTLSVHGIRYKRAIGWQKRHIHCHCRPLHNQETVSYLRWTGCRAICLCPRALQKSHAAQDFKRRKYYHDSVASVLDLRGNLHQVHEMALADRRRSNQDLSCLDGMNSTYNQKCYEDALRCRSVSCHPCDEGFRITDYRRGLVRDGSTRACQNSLYVDCGSIQKSGGRSAECDNQQPCE